MSGWTHEFEIDDPDWNPVNFPTTYGRDPNSPSQIMTWLIHYLGRTDYRRSAGTWRYSIQDIVVHGNKKLRLRFRDPKDAMLFKLYWL